MNNIIDFLLDENFSVLVVDLPCHGLSKGRLVWVEHILKLKPINNKIIVFQGDQDGSLNCKNNRTHLKEKFPLLKFHLKKNPNTKSLMNQDQLKRNFFGL